MPAAKFDTGCCEDLIGFELNVRQYRTEDRESFVIAAGLKRQVHQGLRGVRFVVTNGDYTTTVTRANGVEAGERFGRSSPIDDRVGPVGQFAVTGGDSANGLKGDGPGGICRGGCPIAYAAQAVGNADGDSLGFGRDAAETANEWPVCRCENASGVGNGGFYAGRFAVEEGGAVLSAGYGAILSLMESSSVPANSVNGRE